jgi:DNA invertase Pin-like site-specific DNA recombinase
MKKTKVYGYCRVSTKKQKVERQIENIKSLFPDAVIVQEAFTGTKMNRPAWSKLEKQLSEGDTVVFDEISRMSRNAEEGYQTYKALYDRGINLVFLKEATLNTENFRKTTQVAMTGTEVDAILEGVNKYLMILAENQIKAAFATAQHEVDFLHKRTSEGVQRAIAEGKQVGIEEGRKLTTKKSIAAKELIKKYNKDFGGSFNDKMTLVFMNNELKEQGQNISRNSYFKYKREMKEEGSQNV